MTSAHQPVSASAPAAAQRERLSQRHALVDASQVAEAHAWLPQIDCRQLRPGQFAGLLERVDFGDLEVVHERHSQHVQKSGAMLSGQCTVSFIEQVDPSARFSQFADHGADQLFFLPEENEFDILAPGGRATCYVRVDQRRLLSDLADINAPLAERLATGADLKALGKAGRLPLEDSLRALRSIAREAGNGKHALDSSALRRTLYEQLLLAVSASEDVIPGTAPRLQARRRALHLVRRAQEYMQDQLRQGINPDLLALHRYTGVSARTLQYAFRDQLGISPAAHLRLLRLNGVRAELLSSTSATRSITTVATRWGFLHPGRFARAYREMFEESPSATLARKLRN